MISAQGKHLQGHRNFDPTKSVFCHSDPQHLVYKHAGKGFSEGAAAGGVPEFKEVVDFEEFIGYVLMDNSLVPTNWGKIHYSKRGTHIVPAPPRFKNN